MNWYDFNQNNSGGYFDVNDKVCHRLFIEAKSFDDAVKKAEELGCYWDGVNKGVGCPCCGDRWHKWSDDPINIEEGYSVCSYGGICKDTITMWNEKYGSYEVIEEPIWKKEYGIREYAGRIKFRNIEEYAQFVADEYGWTVPDVRIYYHDGNVKEIFSKKMTISD